MAIKQMIERTFVIKSADTYVAGDVGMGVYGIMPIHLRSNLFTGSITVKGRVTGSGAPFVAIPYRKFNLNGTVGDASLVSTAITDTSLIQIDNAAGFDIALDCTTYTGGQMTVTTNPTGSS